MGLRSGSRVRTFIYVYYPLDTYISLNAYIYPRYLYLPRYLLPAQIVVSTAVIYPL